MWEIEVVIVVFKGVKTNRLAWQGNPPSIPAMPGGRSEPFNFVQSPKIGASSASPSLILWRMHAWHSADFSTLETHDYQVSNSHCEFLVYCRLGFQRSQHIVWTSTHHLLNWPGMELGIDFECVTGGRLIPIPTRRWRDSALDAFQPSIQFQFPTKDLS